MFTILRPPDRRSPVTSAPSPLSDRPMVALRSPLFPPHSSAARSSLSGHLCSLGLCVTTLSPTSGAWREISILTSYLYIGGTSQPSSSCRRHLSTLLLLVSAAPLNPPPPRVGATSQLSSSCRRHLSTLLLVSASPSGCVRAVDKHVVVSARPRIPPSPTQIQLVWQRGRGRSVRHADRLDRQGPPTTAVPPLRLTADGNRPGMSPFQNDPSETPPTLSGRGVRQHVNRELHCSWTLSKLS